MGESVCAASLASPAGGAWEPLSRTRFGARSFTRAGPGCDKARAVHPHPRPRAARTLAQTRVDMQADAQPGRACARNPRSWQAFSAHPPERRRDRLRPSVRYGRSNRFRTSDFRPPDAFTLAQRRRSRSLWTTMTVPAAATTTRGATVANTAGLTWRLKGARGRPAGRRSCGAGARSPRARARATSGTDRPALHHSDGGALAPALADALPALTAAACRRSRAAPAWPGSTSRCPRRARRSPGRRPAGRCSGSCSGTRSAW